MISSIISITFPSILICYLGVTSKKTFDSLESSSSIRFQVLIFGIAGTG